MSGQMAYEMSHQAIVTTHSGQMPANTTTIHDTNNCNSNQNTIALQFKIGGLNNLKLIWAMALTTAHWSYEMALIGIYQI